MKKSRKHHDSSDFSEGDRHTHKYSRHASHHNKHLADDVASHNQRKHGKHSRHRQDNSPRYGTAPIGRSTSDDRPTHQGNKSSSDRGHYKQSIADVARHGFSSDDPQLATAHGGDANFARSDSSDEILIKHRASRRPPRNTGGGDIARQIKNIEKAQREALRPLSAESQEIHVHYVPIVTRSASPPQMDHDDHRPLSLAATSPETGGVSVRKSLAQGLSASDVKTQFKDLTMSWFTKRSTQQPNHAHRCHSSPRQSKHERRDKHGKKRVLQPTSTSKYLAPLAQRWVCYKCGKVRSDSIQDRHPLRGGKKMQPNWCGKCRVNGELKGRPLDWNGQGHYCWGCGIVRSKKYHCENPVAEGEASTPNYCKRCRELSPSFERNLRETSEIGSEIDLRDQAFRRQMYDASMSDIDEDDDDGEIATAPGKENEDPNKPRKLTATQSFILKHGATTTKTSSDSSFSSASESGGVPIDMLKAMHLDADRARGLSCSKSEHFRLSGESYKPPSVESLPGAGDNDTEMQDAYASATFGGVDPSAQNFSPHHDQCSSSADKGCQTVPDSPVVILTSAQHRVSAIEPTAAAHSNKKSVRWGKDLSSCPATAENTTGFAPQPYHSDSGFSSSGYRSDVSMRSASSARGRLRRPPPGEYSTGSPPAREGTAIPAQKDGRGEKDCLDSLKRKTSQRPGQRPQWNSNSHSGQHLPTSQSTFEDDVGNLTGTGEGLSMPDLACGPTLSGFPCAANNNLSTPPESHDQPKGAATTGSFPGEVGRGNPGGLRKWDCSFDQQIPNFSRPYQSPMGEMRTETAYPVAETYPSSPGYGTRPDYVRQQQQQHPHPAYPAFSSATRFSDSTTRRDFSGYTAAPASEETASYQQYMDSLSPDPNVGLGYYSNYKQEWEVPFDGQGQQPNYHHYSGNFSNPPAPQTCSAFDFSYLDEGQKDTETKFVRRNKTSSTNSTATAAGHPTTTPSRSQHWYLDEDDDATFEIYESGGGGQGNYQWDDGHTTIHRSGSNGPSLPYHHDTATASNQPRNVVTILSIREITSDEELSGNDGNDSPRCEEYDTDSDDNEVSGGSDLGTIIHRDSPSTIC